MEIKRRTEILIETHERTVIRVRDSQYSFYCERCRKTTTAFAPEQIAALFQISLTDVCRLIETNELHLVGTRRGAAYVCGSSLGAKYKNYLILKKE